MFNLNQDAVLNFGEFGLGGPGHSTVASVDEFMTPRTGLGSERPDIPAGSISMEREGGFLPPQLDDSVEIAGNKVCKFTSCTCILHRYKHRVLIAIAYCHTIMTDVWYRTCIIPNALSFWLMFTH